MAVRVPFGEREPRDSCKSVVKQLSRESLISGALRFDEMAVVFRFSPRVFRPVFFAPGFHERANSSLADGGRDHGSLAVLAPVRRPDVDRQQFG